MQNIKEDLTNIKEKLLEQITQQYSPEQAQEFIKKIKAMNDEELVEFLKKQGIIKGEGQGQDCIFCALASNKMPRTEIGENEDAIAILDINPISKGHALIIPKKHLSSEKEITQQTKELSEKTKKEILKAFKPQRIDEIPTNAMGHQLINLLPVYNNETIDSERSKETPENLQKIKKEIEDAKTKTIEEKKPEKIEEKVDEKKSIPEEKLWLRPRIP